MHPSQASAFRKTVIALLSIMFGGALLIFTSLANLDLLKTVYPDPRFYMFGLLALEGGAVFWIAQFLLNLHGVHKALAVFSLAIDMLFSSVGFFYEMESTTSQVGTVALPPVIVIVAGAVLFNVIMVTISHLITASTSPAIVARPKEAAYEEGYQAVERQQNDGPGFFTNAAASVLAAGQDVVEQARIKRQKKVLTPETEPVAVPNSQTPSGK